MRTRSGRLDSRRPFRRAEALQAGVSIRELTGPKFQNVFHGVYVAAGVRLDDVERARAALYISPAGSYASHHTAALIWGGIPPTDSRTHISVPDGRSRSERRGIAAHRAIGSPDLRDRQSVPVSSPRAEFLRGRQLGIGTGRPRHPWRFVGPCGVVTADVLIAAADEWTHQRAATASRAARFVREGVDSAMESRLRMLIVLAGLPEPDVNYVIRHANGEWKMRFDLCYPELKLLIEYDGDQHSVDPRQWARDLERREELQHLGWRFVTIQKHHYYGNPAGILDRICQARLDCGAPASSCRIRTTWVNDYL